MDVARASSYFILHSTNKISMKENALPQRVIVPQNFRFQKLNVTHCSFVPPQIIMIIGLLCRVHRLSTTNASAIPLDTILDWFSSTAFFKIDLPKLHFKKSKKAIPVTGLGGL
jgi:hypothetical protein